MLEIGPWKLPNALFLAPMVGVCDTPFREICARQGAGLTIAEMLSCNTALWSNPENRLKQIKPGLPGPQVVQIVGSDPAMMSEAARINVELGADGIDINMGCPARKVLKKAAGSALLRDETQVRKILEAVVGAVDVPVSLKIRTGWSAARRNGVVIAGIAEDCGVQLLAVHGRTRECRFRGEAEYDTIAAIKQAVSIPVIANGDVDSPEKAAKVLRHTRADGLMIGRAALGRPWIFREIQQFLDNGRPETTPSLLSRSRVIIAHLKKLHGFYGEIRGVWYARKHVAGYLKGLPQAREFLSGFNQIDSSGAQLEQIQTCFHRLIRDERAIAP